MVIDCKGFVYSKLIRYVASILLFFFTYFDLSFPSNSNGKKQVVVFPHSVEAIRSIS